MKYAILCVWEGPMKADEVCDIIKSGLAQSKLPKDTPLVIVSNTPFKNLPTQEGPLCTVFYAQVADDWDVKGHIKRLKCTMCEREATQFVLEEVHQYVTARCKTHPITTLGADCREVSPEEALQYPIPGNVLIVVNPKGEPR